MPRSPPNSTLFPYTTLFRSYGAAVMAHDDIDAVEAVGAAGVHLPGGSNPAAARRRLPEGLIGVSTHSAGEARSEEHTSELQSRRDLVCRLLLEKKNHPWVAH